MSRGKHSDHSLPIVLQQMIGKPKFSGLEKSTFSAVKFPGPFLAGNCAEKIIYWVPLWRGGSFLLTVGPFLLTVELLCLQSVEVLLRHTFPLQQSKGAQL